ncbi:serine/threonine protein phosphatase 7, putative [Plasmodium ovale curtisi]|uniref:Serine/threonine-protein phosphatase n=1 Tax=Plasmodium ovale curtisi TaxID=864141 RepID=A0A1A8W3D0_PLAOA|nr:serine/threonine protein phosphatase 7, putative [Plasmodium ovale curtisi]
METYSEKDTVMVYGHKATILCVKDIPDGKNKSVVHKIYAAKYANKPGYTDGMYRKQRIYTPEKDQLIIFCSNDSVKPYSEKESACLMIQKLYRGYQARKEFHSLVCSIVWRKFENLHENLTLNNHDGIYKPLIKTLNEDIKNGKIQFNSKCFSSNSNQFSRVSTTSYESSAYDENVPKLKDKIDKNFAVEMFHFFLTTKNVNNREELRRWRGTAMETCSEGEILRFANKHGLQNPYEDSKDAGRKHKELGYTRRYVKKVEGHKADCKTLGEKTPRVHVRPSGVACIPSHEITKKNEKKKKNYSATVQRHRTDAHIDPTALFFSSQILGDVHGQLNDVLWLFNRFGLPSYIFNGDIADRGENATEIFLLLFVFKLSSYDSVIINRGNHECSYMNEVYGFYNEVLSKYDNTVFDLFQGVFELLGLAVNIQIHGGLSRYQDLTVQEIDDLDRRKHEILHPEKYEDTIIFDLLWSDPQKNKGIGGNARGNNCITFGPDITDIFLKKNNFDIIIRSHQVPKTLKGIESHHEGKCITLFSASNYCNKIKNLGAAIVFNQDLTFEVQEYMSPSLDIIRETFEENQKLREKVLHSSKILELEKNVVVFSSYVFLRFHGHFVFIDDVFYCLPLVITTAQEQRKSRKISSDGMMSDILSFLSALICHEKNSLWNDLYEQDRGNTGVVHINTWKTELENLSKAKKVPWIYLCKQLKMVENGKVNYNKVLSRFKINYAPSEKFINTEWKSECFEHLYEALLKADLSLRETLMVFDKNLDGKVSFAEFEQVLKDLNIDLSNEQIRILVRLINSNSLCNQERVQENDKIDVAEFIGKMRVCYRLSINKEYTNNEKIKRLIETIGKHILADSADTANFHYRFYEEQDDADCSDRRKRSSVIKSVALFQKFKNYDNFGNGYLDYDDFVKAIKNFDMNKISKEVEFEVDDGILMELAKSIDITKSSKINFLEFLQAFYVVNKSKYSYVDEIWCHICTVIYENKFALKKCMKHLEDTIQGKITSIHFRYILLELNKLLQEHKHERNKPLTDEQIDLLSYTVETDDKIDYVEFLNSFKPSYFNLPLRVRTHNMEIARKVGLKTKTISGSDIVNKEDILKSGIYTKGGQLWVADISVIVNIQAKLGEGPWNIQSMDVIQRENENELEHRHGSSDDIISDIESEERTPCARNSNIKNSDTCEREIEGRGEEESDDGTGDGGDDGRNEESDIHGNVRGNVGGNAQDALSRDSPRVSDRFYETKVKFEACETVEETLKSMVQQKCVNLHPVVKEFILLLLFLFGCMRKDYCRGISQNGHSNAFFQKASFTRFDSEEKRKTHSKESNNKSKTKVKFMNRSEESSSIFFANIGTKDDGMVRESSSSCFPREISSDAILTKHLCENSKDSQCAGGFLELNGCNSKCSESYSRVGDSLANVEENDFFKVKNNCIFFNLYEMSKYEYNMEDIEQAFSRENINKVCELLYKHLHKVRKMKNEKITKNNINIVIVLLYLISTYFGLYFLRTKKVYIQLHDLYRQFCAYKNKNEEEKKRMNRKIEEHIEYIKISEQYEAECEKYKSAYDGLRIENDKLKMNNVLVHKLKKKINFLNNEKLIILKKKEELEHIIKQKNILIENNKMIKIEKETKQNDFKKTKLILKKDFTSLCKVKSSVSGKNITYGNDKDIILLQGRHQLGIERNREYDLGKKLMHKYVYTRERETQTVACSFKQSKGIQTLGYSVVDENEENNSSTVFSRHGCYEHGMNKGEDIEQVILLLTAKEKEKTNCGNVLSYLSVHYGLSSKLNINIRGEKLVMGFFKRRFTYFDTPSMHLQNRCNKDEIMNFKRELLVEHVCYHMMKNYLPFEESLFENFPSEWLKHFSPLYTKKCPNRDIYVGSHPICSITHQFANYLFRFSRIISVAKGEIYSRKELLNSTCQHPLNLFNLSYFEKGIFISVVGDEPILAMDMCQMCDFDGVEMIGMEFGEMKEYIRHISSGVRSRCNENLDDTVPVDPLGEILRNGLNKQMDKRLNKERDTTPSEESYCLSFPSTKTITQSAQNGVFLSPIFGKCSKRTLLGMEKKLEEKLASEQTNDCYNVPLFRVYHFSPNYYYHNDNRYSLICEEKKAALLYSKMDKLSKNNLYKHGRTNCYSDFFLLDNIHRVIIRRRDRSRSSSPCEKLQNERRKYSLNRKVRHFSKKDTPKNSEHKNILCNFVQNKYCTFRKSKSGPSSDTKLWGSSQGNSHSWENGSLVEVTTLFGNSKSGIVFYDSQFNWGSCFFSSFESDHIYDRENCSCGECYGHEGIYSRGSVIVKDTLYTGGKSNGEKKNLNRSYHRGYLPEHGNKKFLLKGEKRFQKKTNIKRVIITRISKLSDEKNKSLPGRKRSTWKDVLRGHFHKGADKCDTFEIKPSAVKKNIYMNNEGVSMEKCVLPPKRVSMYKFIEQFDEAVWKGRLMGVLQKGRQPQFGENFLTCSKNYSLLSRENNIIAVRSLNIETVRFCYDEIAKFLNGRHTSSFCPSSGLGCPSLRSGNCGNCRHCATVFIVPFWVKGKSLNFGKCADVKKEKKILIVDRWAKRVPRRCRYCSDCGRTIKVEKKTKNVLNSNNKKIATKKKKKNSFDKNVNTNYSYSLVLIKCMHILSISFFLVFLFLIDSHFLNSSIFSFLIYVLCLSMFFLTSLFKSIIWLLNIPLSNKIIPQDSLDFFSIFFVQIVNYLHTCLHQSDLNVEFA